MSSLKKASKKQIKIEQMLDRRQENAMNIYSLLRLINEYFWKSMLGPFFAFAFPLFFTALLGYLMSYNLVLGGAISIGSIIIGVYSLPNSIYDFKNSSLLKRIGVTPIKPITFILTVCAYYVAIMIISIFWVMLLSLILFAGNWTTGGSVIIDPSLVSSLIFDIFHVWGTVEVTFPSILEVLGNIEWGGFIFSQFYVILTSVAMGMMIVSIAKTPVLIQTLGILTIIICIILGGQVVPIYMVKSISPLWYLGYAIDPFKCSMDMGIEAWNGPGSTMQLSVIFNDTELYNGIADINIMNLTNSTIWNTSNNMGVIYINVDGWSEQIPLTDPSKSVDLNSYWVFSTVSMPTGLNPGAIEIVTTIEKILNFIVPLLWIGLFLTVAATKFKWTTR